MHKQRHHCILHLRLKLSNSSLCCTVCFTNYQEYHLRQLKKGCMSNSVYDMIAYVVHIHLHVLESDLSSQIGEQPCPT